MASVIPPDQPDRLTQIFNGIKNDNPDVRAQAADDLTRFVAMNVRDMSSDAAWKFWDDIINRRLFELTHSQNSAEAFGGLLAIGMNFVRHQRTLNEAFAREDSLLKVDQEESIKAKGHLFRFYNYAKHLLTNHDVDLALAASRTLDYIIKIGGPTFGERWLDYEVPAAIELMRPDNQESTRYAGVLTLKACAKNGPDYFHTHVGIVFDNILGPLRDESVTVREGAAELLAACLEIVAQRAPENKSSYLSKVLLDAQAGLEQHEPEVIHGSLLTYQQLLLHAETFMRENASDATEQIIQFQSHSDPLVRKSALSIIPLLDVHNT